MPNASIPLDSNSVTAAAAASSKCIAPKRTKTSRPMSKVDTAVVAVALLRVVSKVEISLFTTRWTTSMIAWTLELFKALRMNGFDRISCCFVRWWIGHAEDADGS